MDKLRKHFFSRVTATVTSAAALSLNFFRESGKYVANSNEGNIVTPGKISDGNFQLDYIRLMASISEGTDDIQDILQALNQFLSSSQFLLDKSQQEVISISGQELLSPDSAGTKTIGAPAASEVITQIRGLEGTPYFFDQEGDRYKPIIRQDESFTCTLDGYWPTALAAAGVKINAVMAGKFVYKTR